MAYAPFIYFSPEKVLYLLTEVGGVGLWLVRVGDEMKNVIGICGYHNSGKTTLIERLIRRLKRDGYRIATVKNIPKRFSIDTEGKDTWRHGEAGASVVVSSSPNETAFIFKRGMALTEIVDILDKIAHPDLILVEGRKKEKIPKISVGDIELEDAVRYDDNLDEILSWMKNLRSLYHENGDPDMQVESPGEQSHGDGMNRAGLE